MKIKMKNKKTKWKRFLWQEILLLDKIPQIKLNKTYCNSTFGGPSISVVRPVLYMERHNE